MTHLKPLIVLVLLATAFVGKWVMDKNQPAATAVVTPSAVPSVHGPSSSPSEFKQPWTQEEEWLIDEICRDIAEILLFASAPSAFNPEQLSLKVTPIQAQPHSYELSLSVQNHPPHTQQLDLAGHLWSPANYHSLATAAAAALQLSANRDSQATPILTDLPERLLNPDPQLLAEINLQLAGQLTQASLNPAIHEQAALLIGYWAFRESAGKFSDVRCALCRMTAHLTIAGLSSQDPSPIGKLASTIQLALIDRQADALNNLKDLKTSGSIPIAWIHAIELRSTGDWRLLTEPEKQSFIEQIAFARSVTSSLDNNPLLDLLEEHDLPEVPDWHRIALSRSFSVEQGHAFATPSVPAELEEATRHYQAFTKQKAPEPKKFLAALNEPGTRAVSASADGSFSIQPVSWGSMAAFHQRHLMHAISSTHYFFQSRWGVPEEAESLRQAVDQHFSGLRLTPLLVATNVCDGKATAEALQAAAEFAVANPHLVTACVWYNISNTRAYSGSHSRPPPASSWFRHGLLFGSPFEYAIRHCELHCVPMNEQNKADNLATLAPYDYHILFGLADTLGVDRSSALKQALAPILDFHLRAAVDIADLVKHDSKAYIQAMQPVCELNPNESLALANLLKERGLQKEATDAFIHAFEKAPDRVRVANNAGWYIHYLADNQNIPLAIKIAEHAAEVFSFRGLEAAAGLMEKLERWQDAKTYYEDIAERYGSNGPLIAFLSKHQENVSEVKAQFDLIIAQTFPDGKKAATLSDQDGPPKSGAVFTSESQHTQQYQIKTGDIVVALDSIQIENMKQYELVRALSPNAPLQLILWDGSAYREVVAHVPDRRFQCGMESYLPR